MTKYGWRRMAERGGWAVRKEQEDEAWSGSLYRGDTGLRVELHARNEEELDALLEAHWRALRGPYEAR